jgi:TolB-like protein/Tfp pilus assembly protein PilF/predicted Ser/Thr protein kinase
MIGKTISHYKILSKLGEGGMGVVYKAQDTKLDRTVALKFLPAHLLSDEEARTRFVHEAKAASALDHPNIATIHEIDAAEGQSFISMAYVDGKRLQDIVREERIPLERVLDVAVQMGEGLSAAHKRGIVHRDIKSDNIMVTADGVVKIMDFGLAKLGGVSKVTKPGSTVGTVAYMSPEQCQGMEVDERSDIFSFGVVLYEMITAQLPFKGEHEAAIVYSICNQDPEPLARYKTGVPEELQRIVAKALQKDPAVRYQTVADMLADLRHLRKKGLGRSASAPKRRRVTARAAIAVGVTFLVVLVGYAMLSRFLGPPEQTPGGAGRKSIAVLPFKNMATDPENEWFSDGITEDIITQLSKVADLRVVSRTSVMLYKNTEKNLRQIGEELGVAAILEGSVRRSGGRVRIVSQLIDARTDEHIWAETYDREMSDIFEIQSDVAQKIAKALEAELSPDERERIEQTPTKNLTAYDYYLRGRDYYNRYRKQDNENAVELFERALELDPGFAAAYAGLSDAYSQRAGRFGFSDAWTDSGIEVAKKAISVDPNCAEAHKALGLAYMQKGWLRESLAHTSKAIDLNPNSDPAIGNMGWLSMFIGQYDEAMKWLKRSAALHPVHPFTFTGLGAAYIGLTDFEKAEFWNNKALELEPDLYDSREALIYISLLQREYGEARKRAEELLSMAPDRPSALDSAGDVELFSGNFERARGFYERAKELSTEKLTRMTSTSHILGLGYVYWKEGRREEATQMFEEYANAAKGWLEQGNEWNNIPYNMASIDAVKGNKEEAYVWLRKAIDAGWRNYLLAESDPMLENLRGDEQFKKLMAEMKAIVDDMRKRVESD